MTGARQFPQGSRVDDLDLSGVHLHAVMLEGARITDADLRGADISGELDGLRVNGVEIEPLVRAELDRRHPERIKLRSTDILGLRRAWTMLEDLWAATTARAERLSPRQQHQRFGGEWSFVETIRHLICATDLWLIRGVQLTPPPYHRWGLPWSGADDAWARELGLDPSATPDLVDLLPVRREQQLAVRTELDDLTDDQLTDVRTAPGPGHPTGPHSVLRCLHVVMNEEWEHHRYATRDLDLLEG